MLIFFSLDGLCCPFALYTGKCLFSAASLLTQSPQSRQVHHLAVFYSRALPEATLSWTPVSVLEPGIAHMLDELLSPIMLKNIPIIF